MEKDVSYLVACDSTLTLCSIPVEVYPIIAITGLAVGGATWFLTRLARGPEVIWDKKVSEQRNLTSEQPNSLEQHRAWYAVQDDELQRMYALCMVYLFCRASSTRNTSVTACNLSYI